VAEGRRGRPPASAPLRRRLARVAAVAATLGIVAWLTVSAGEGTPTAARGGGSSRGETQVRLPDGCRTEPERTPAPPEPIDTRPDLALEPGRDYRAVIHTSCGELSLDLLEERAPATVANFVFLARRGFYDGMVWHRVERDALIQTGDPSGHNLDGYDDPGYRIQDEITATEPREYVYGIVAMANAGADTGGSQFFVVTHDPAGALEGDPEPAGLKPDYTIFAEVQRRSWETLKRLAAVRTKGGEDLVTAVEPIVPAFVDSIEIEAGP
jgi:cyclophilin family peptidyl-prolyl cis-trans isomerase